MQAVAFYLVLPFLYLIASLPFWALYKVSDFLYYLFLISGYRSKWYLKTLGIHSLKKIRKKLMHCAKLISATSAT